MFYTQWIHLVSNLMYYPTIHVHQFVCCYSYIAVLIWLRQLYVMCLPSMDSDHRAEQAASARSLHWPWLSSASKMSCSPLSWVIIWVFFSVGVAKEFTLQKHMINRHYNNIMYLPYIWSLKRQILEDYSRRSNYSFCLLRLDYLKQNYFAFNLYGCWRVKTSCRLLTSIDISRSSC